MRTLHKYSFSLFAHNNHSPAVSTEELHRIMRASVAGFFLKSFSISTVFTALSFRSCCFTRWSISHLWADSSPSEMSLIRVVSSADFSSLTDSWLEVQLSEYREKRRRNTALSQYWWFGGQKHVFPISHAASCQTGSLWSTYRWNPAHSAGRACPVAELGWLYWTPNWSLQTGSWRCFLRSPGAGG